MIVCSCNILSDQDVRALASDPSYVPPRMTEIYNRLGCNAECGRCARTIRAIINEAAATTAVQQLAETPDEADAA
jgi:bacterioferritin-associated ferredoxin